MNPRAAVSTTVPGSQTTVWDAVATGPGISSWFYPTEIVENADGTATVTTTFTPEMVSVATRIRSDAPRSFYAQSNGAGPGAPLMHTSWEVEETGENQCTVRVTHWMETEADTWDKLFANIESGWPQFFVKLNETLTQKT